jgi:hypothetical protein
MEIPDPIESLLSLARQKLGNLTPADEKLFRSVATGEWADFQNGDEEKDKPANADQWGEDRTILANRISWLCNDRQAKDIVTHNGIRIMGAKIIGRLNLNHIDINFCLEVVSSTLPHGIEIRQGNVRGLDFEGSQTGPISADRIKVAGSIFLRNDFEAKGEVRLLNAEIGGSLECSNGRFRASSAATNPNNKAFSADGIRVGGAVFLDDGFEAAGEVRLLNAEIGGIFCCNKGHFNNPGNFALAADGAVVAGSVFLSEGFLSNGEVRLTCTRIGQVLSCENGQFINSNGKALDVEGATVGGSIFMRAGFRADGEVNLKSAIIGGNLECDGGKFSNPQGITFAGDQIKVAGSIFLRNDFDAKGEVRLLAAEIGNNLDCRLGMFSNPKGRDGSKGYALNAERVRVGNNVFLRDGFKAEGEVLLSSADIRGNLECAAGQFINAEGIAIRAEMIVVGGNVTFRNHFRAVGKILLLQANIRNGLACTNIDPTSIIILDLRDAKVGIYWDDIDSWPNIGMLYLDGFKYGKLFEAAPHDATSRIRWLRRQPADQFYPQPYEQLAAVFKEEGLEENAKKILIAKEEDPAYLRSLSKTQIFAHDVLRIFLAYGYRPWRALKYALIFIVLGWFFFGIGYESGLISPTTTFAYVKNSDPPNNLPDGYPEFNPFIYSLDVFLPVVDLHQESHWLPHRDLDNQGQYLPTQVRWSWRLFQHTLMWYLWVQIVFGWILISLFIAGFPRVFRR